MLELLTLLLIMASEMQNNQPIAGIGNTDYSELAHLISYALTDKTNKNRIIQLAPVSDQQKEIVKTALGINLEGYHHTIDMFGIRHIFSKHGDVAKEKSRGQIAVEPFDIMQIPLIISSPDVVRLSKEKTKEGRDAFHYEKQINDYMYFIEEIRTGRKQLAATTLYKRKATR